MDYSYLESWRKNFLAKTNGRGAKLANFLLAPPINSNDIVFDLHNHSECSDGEIPDSKMLADAEENQVKIFSITDHDTIKFYDNLYSGKVDTSNFSGEIINGVEITSRLNGYPVEILLYDFDYKKFSKKINNFEFPYLNRSFKIMRNVTNLQKRINILNSMNITKEPLALNDFIGLETGEYDENKNPICIPIKKFGLDAQKDLLAHTIYSKSEIEVNGETYKVNYDFLNKKLFLKLFNDTKSQKFLNEYSSDTIQGINTFAEFNRHLVQSPGSILWIDDSDLWPTAEEIAQVAEEVGGIAVLAHPYLYPNLKVKPEDLMKYAVQARLDGIECIYEFFTEEQIQKVYDFCYQRNMLVTGGSDRHKFITNPQYEAWEHGKLSGSTVNKVTVPKKKLSGATDFIGTYNLHYFGNNQKSIQEK